MSKATEKSKKEKESHDRLAMRRFSEGKCSKCESPFVSGRKMCEKHLAAARKNTDRQRAEKPDEWKEREARKREKQKNDPVLAAKAKKYFSDRYRKKKISISAKSKIRYQNNRAAIIAAAKEYSNRPEVQPILKKRRKKYYTEHREEIIERVAEWRKMKFATDPVFVMEARMRNRVYCALRDFKGGRVKKSKRATELLGCTVPEFAAHIESLFLPGMTWENRKEWHIDHKRPCSSFNLADLQEQKKCFHYMNQQPLWAHDNVSKSDKWEEEKVA